MITPTMAKALSKCAKHRVPLIITVEAFYKEPKMLYDFLRQAAVEDVMVQVAPIHTTDQAKIRVQKDNSIEKVVKINAK